MTRIVSQLDAAGVFVGLAIAHASPLEPGQFLIPGGAVDIEPPEVPDGYRARLVDGAWVFEVLPPPDAPTPEEQPDVWERIKAERDRRTQTGGYQTGGHWYHSDTFSRTQQLGLVMLGTGLPEGLQWKTMSGAFVTMTPALAQAIFAAATASDMAHFAHAEYLRGLVETADDPASVDIYAGWPAIFGEA